MRFKASQIAAAVGGTLTGEDVWLEGATQDSRLVTRACLFVPLIGRRNGHEFIQSAMDRGAGAFLTSEEVNFGPAIRVDDTSAALKTLASVARHSLDGPVVGITGSVGKTSTKDLTKSILARVGPVHASPSSYNNEIGVPLTLLGASRIGPLVLEFGARRQGDIGLLCEIGRPDVGVLTTIAAAHTSEFGSLDAVAETKGELFRCLPPDGCAIFNADVPEVVTQATFARCRKLSFGYKGEVRARNVEIDDELRATFWLESPWGKTELKLSARGIHMVPNALSAAAVGLVLGAPLEEVADGLSDGPISPLRMQLATASSGFQVLNDTYNANPPSMVAALRALAALPVSGRRIAFLGMMAELGERAVAEHLSITQCAVDLGIQIVAIDTELYGVGRVRTLEDAECEFLLTEDDAVLVKGSRVVGLEVLADRLLHS